MLTIILASILIAVIFAPLGCIVLWKRYVCFGDGLAHSSLLAGAISVAANVPVAYSSVIVATSFALVTTNLQNASRNIISRNALISLISSTMLALSLIIAAIKPSRVNINNLLFGDILSANNNDIIILSVLLVITAYFVYNFYTRIVFIALNKDIAKIHGIKAGSIELLFLILLSLVILLTIKIVGALLVTSMLLIPAMAARLLSTNPWQMIMFAVLIALISNLVGLYASFYFDLPIAPVIIMISTTVYMLCYTYYRYFKN